MSDSFWTNLFMFLTAALSAWIAYKQQQASKNIKLIEKATNSMKDALVKATGDASHAEGKLEGVAMEQARDKSKQ